MWPRVGATGQAPCFHQQLPPGPGPSPEDLFLLADNLLQLLNLILFAIKYILLLCNVRLNFCGGESQGGGVAPSPRPLPELRPSCVGLPRPWLNMNSC